MADNNIDPPAPCSLLVGAGRGGEADCEKCEEADDHPPASASPSTAATEAQKKTRKADQMHGRERDMR